MAGDYWLESKAGAGPTLKGMVGASLWPVHDVIV